ncbi:MAG: hypothetical protein FJZ92_07700 [Chloroflexi bacterium]|nr:hypothetical protein [Chloroflexota bacterium]
MPHLAAEASVDVERTPEAVWRYVSDIEKMGEWVDGVSDVRLTSPAPYRVGSTFESQYHYRGKDFAVAYRCTQLEPPRVHAMESTSGPFPFKGRLTLEPAGAGTRVVNHLEAGSDSWFTSFMFRALAPLTRRMLRGQLAKELRKLKERVEAAA